MITVVSYYFMLLILLQPIEEIHNCNNPNTIGIIPHYVCDWDEDDFYTNVNGKKILSKQNKLIIFDNDQPHTGSTCTDERIRVVINFNYVES